MTIPTEKTIINLHVVTSITQGDEHEVFTFDEAGTLLHKNGASFIKYQEPQDDGSKATVLFKINPDGTVQLTRHGQSDLRLVFKENARQSTRYLTPMGPMVIETLTNSIDASINVERSQGNLNIIYSLYQGDYMVGQYIVHVDFIKA